MLPISCFVVVGQLSAGSVPDVGAIRIDRWVLVFTAAASLLTGILFGLFPALRTARLDLSAAEIAPIDRAHADAHVVGLGLGLIENGVDPGLQGKRLVTGHAASASKINWEGRQRLRVAGGYDFTCLIHSGR